MIEVFKAKAVKTDVGLQVSTSARDFTILMDEPESIGGTNTAMNPVEALLCSLGACQAIVAAAFAQAKGFKFEEFYLELEGDLDLDGFTGVNPNVRNGFSEIRFSVHFKTEESQEACEEYADFIEKTCPICDCLTTPVKIVRTSVVRD